jgi:hypothetical protein
MKQLYLLDPDGYTLVFPMAGKIVVPEPLED